MTSEEKQELKRKWIEALRSGEWKQHRGSSVNRYKENKEFTKENASFCCLGVLGMITCGDPYRGLDNYHMLYPTHHPSLVPLNDAKGKTFLEIADYIESLDGPK